jgi:hypothetical protein
MPEGEGDRGRGVRGIMGRWTEYDGPPRPLHLADGRIVMGNPGDLILVREVNGEVVCLWHRRRIVN